MSSSEKLAILQDFYNEVCRRAEENMLKTGKLEGAHYAAMKQVLQEIKENTKIAGSIDHDNI